MEETYESTSYCVMFEDDVRLQETDWDYLLSNKVKFDDWKKLEYNNIKMHVKKVKDKMLVQFEK